MSSVGDSCHTPPCPPTTWCFTRSDEVYPPLNVNMGSSLPYTRKRGGVVTSDDLDLPKDAHVEI